MSRFLRSKAIFALLLLGFAATAGAAIEVIEFESEEQTQRYQQLIAELRCLVCQNQNLADSNAGLAVDLKNIVQQQINEGKSDSEILSFMTDRYGDFVLYRPPMKTSTLMLWFGPVLFISIGAAMVLSFVRKSQRARVSVSDAELDDVRQLLDTDPSLNSDKSLNPERR